MWKGHNRTALLGGYCGVPLRLHRGEPAGRHGDGRMVHKKAERTIPCCCRRLKADTPQSSIHWCAWRIRPGTGRTTRARQFLRAAIFPSNKQRALKCDEVTSVESRPGLFLFLTRPLWCGGVKGGGAGASTTRESSETAYEANLLPPSLPPFGHNSACQCRIGLSAVGRNHQNTGTGAIRSRIARHHLALSLFSALVGCFSCVSHTFIAVFLRTACCLQHGNTCTMITELARKIVLEIHPGE